MKKLVRFLVCSVYLALTATGIVYIAAGFAGLTPWAGCGMLLLSCMAGYAVSGFVKKRAALVSLLAAAAVAAGNVLLLPYGGWNYVLALVSLICLILAARHNWNDPETQLIDTRLMAAGLVVCAIGYLIALLNVLENVQTQLGYTLYVYIVITIVLVNRKSIQLNAGGQARRMMRSNQALAWVFIGIFTLVVFFRPLQKAVGDGVRWVIGMILNLFDRPVEYEATQGGEAPTQEMDMSALGGDTVQWPAWLQTLSDIFLHAVTIIAVIALLAGIIFALIKALKALSKYLKIWLSTFGSMGGGEDYAEESEQLMSAQNMRKQFADDVMRRVKKVFERPVRWGALSPNERVRHVYGRLLEQQKQYASTAENLTPQELCARAEKDAQFAELYDKVRYAEEQVSAEDAEKYRVYLKS